MSGTQAHSSEKHSSSRLLAVGSYTAATGGRGTGISVVDAGSDADADARGRLRVVSAIAADSPSFLAWWAPTRTLFAANETRDGEVSSFRLSADGTLIPIDARQSGGGRPCHLAVHPSGRWIVASNYAGATFVVISVEPSGRLGRVTSVIEHGGKGIHPTRQDQPHPHTVIFTPDGRWALLVDVGLDTVSVHEFEHGTLKPEPTSVAHCSPGAGPRHAIWLTDGMLAVDEEISGTLSTFNWNGCGRLEGPIATVPSTRDGAPDAWPSELQRIDDRTALVANRTRGLLTEFSLTQPRTAGTAAPNHLLTEAIRDLRLPSPNVRHFWADSATAYLALQDSDQLVSLDLSTGTILGRLQLGSPAYIVSLDLH